VRRADRLYRITEYLRGRRLTTAAWLAERLRVSVRTVYRDVADLVAAGVPVTGEAGVGYALARRLDLPPLMFDRAELEALALGLRFTQAVADAPLRGAAERAQSKIRAAVPRELAERMRDTPAFVARRDPATSARLAELLAAVDRRQVVRLEYADADGAATRRDVWPLAGLCSALAWTVVCWCELRHDFRTFRLDRIRALKTLARQYPVQPGRTLQDYFIRMRDSYGLSPTDFDPER
jgi:predicted DNA-binding transcriptional regulator YafY